jgi:hypothetical protein
MIICSLHPQFERSQLSIRRLAAASATQFVHSSVFTFTEQPSFALYSHCRRYLYDPTGASIAPSKRCGSAGERSCDGNEI